MLTGNQQDAAQDVAALVRDAQAGDERALNHLVALHLPLIYNIVGRALYTAADVDDLVQETMLRVVRGLPGLREPERFRSWAVAIAYRRLHEHARRRVVEVPHRFDVADVADPSTDFAERTVAELVLTGQRRDLVRATRWLEPADRRLLALWWQEVSGRLGRSELSEALGLDAAHTAVRVQRMRTQLEAARTVVLALDAVPRCPGLAALVQGWDGSTTSVWRKRLTRHTRGCQPCGGAGHALVPPERLLPGIGVLVAPHSLLDGLSAAAGGVAGVGHSLWAWFGSLVHRLTGRPAAAGAAAAVAAAVALTCVIAPWSGPAPGGPPPSPAGSAASGGPGAAPSDSPSSSVTGPSASSLASPPGAGTGGGVTAADIYVAPDGADTGDGSIARPYATLGRAAAVVRPGQTIALRGGTYRLTEPVSLATDGAADRRITLSNYRDERPVLDASAVPAASWAITQQAGYWTVQGLELFGSGSHAYVCRACRYTVFRRLSFHDNARSGLTLRDAGTVGNAVLDSDFFHNHDDAAHGAGGIGLGVTFGSGEGNVVRGCRLYGNATDGLDLGGFGSPVTVESNWSYGNGVNRWRVPAWQGAGNGFTLGGGDSAAAVAHLVRNNAAWDNTGLGFNDEGNPGPLRLTGNTAFRNGVTGFYLPDAAARLSGNAAVGNGRDVRLGPAARSDGNTWDGAGAGTSLFTGTDRTSAEAARPADGALPATGFLVTRDGVGATMTEQQR
ncbi:sigma-70 family RNA polymerase sigma factor [Kitasatospora sp. NBC_00315]|uniref:sigma-70 family RNA polymerase sigma factor n=1 Tax=Kitasatospora sp. NBC_00315 TaxID=2975963 RepID=UPI003252946F